MVTSSVMVNVYSSAVYKPVQHVNPRYVKHTSTQPILLCWNYGLHLIITVMTFMTLSFAVVYLNLCCFIWAKQPSVHYLTVLVIRVNMVETFDLTLFQTTKVVWRQ